MVKNITIEMACSINGFIARENGEEDFLLERGWQIMLEFLKDEYDVLVWGRKTFEAVLSWGEEYINDLKDINIIVLSKKSYQGKNIEFLNNVYFAENVEDVIRISEVKGFEKIFISGGAKTNNEFMVKNVVDTIILNYNPYVISDGIKIFEGEAFENKLKLENIKKEQDGIVQVKYSVIK